MAEQLYKVSYDVVRKLAAPDVVAFRPIYAHAFGIKAGLFLSQLMYWSSKGNDPDGWIYKTRDEWKAETALSRREQETARRRLRDVAVLDEELRGLPAQLHFRVNWEMLLSELQTRTTLLARKSPTSWHESDQLVGAKVTNIPTETTTETTTESGDAHPVWPDWYGALYQIEGFKTDLEIAEEWRERRNISENLAETTALALKGKWPGPKSSPYKDPWATFRSWCLKDLSQPSRNGRRPEINADPDHWDGKSGWDTGGYVGPDGTSASVVR